MSNPEIITLLDFLVSTGFNLLHIGFLTEEKIAAIKGPDGQPLTPTLITQLRKFIFDAMQGLPHIPKRYIDVMGTIHLSKSYSETYLSLHPSQRKTLPGGDSTSSINLTDISVLNSMEKSLKASNREVVNLVERFDVNLDVCFCMDATGSMKEYIKNVKESIIKVANTTELLTGMKPRFALVVYRDYSDGALRHQSFDFSTSIDLENNLSTIQAVGGKDEPEDCFGGLWIAATAVSWKAPARLIIWMGDSPQHGTMYNKMKDDYPEGDPDGQTAAGIFNELKKKHINLVFSKLSERTNCMVSQLETDSIPYGANRFIQYCLQGEMQDFLENVLLDSQEETGTIGDSFGEIKPYSLAPGAAAVISDLWRNEEEAAEVFTLLPYVRRDVHPLLELLKDGPDVKPRNVSVRMTLNPIARGEMRYAFRARITESTGRAAWGVAKESRFKGPHNSKEEHTKQAHIQEIARLLAAIFTKAVQRSHPDCNVSYIPVELIRFQTRRSGENYFSYEEFLPGTFVKFNNNRGFVNKRLEIGHPVLQAFSHYTYNYSRGILIVVDLQGVISGTNYRLTDPAIHTFRPNLLKDPTNLHQKGIAAFFSSHICNEFCLELELKMPEVINRVDPLEDIEAWQVAAQLRLQS